MGYSLRKLATMTREKLESLAVSTGKVTANEAGMMETSQIIAMMIGAVFVSALLPTIMTNLIGINTTGWGTTETTLIQLLPMLVAIVIVAKFSKDV